MAGDGQSACAPGAQGARRAEPYPLPFVPISMDRLKKTAKFSAIVMRPSQG